MGTILDLTGLEMKRSLFSILFFLVTVPLWGQTNDCEIDLKIRGIGIDSSYDTVLRKLGTPITQKKEKIQAEQTCSGETETHITLNYAGLKIICIGDANGRQTTVSAIEITSAKWKVHPAVRIGDTRKQIEAQLGKKGQAENEALFYCTKENLGTVRFTFIKNKLVKISLAETLC